MMYTLFLTLLRQLLDLLEAIVPLLLFRMSFIILFIQRSLSLQTFLCRHFISTVKQQRAALSTLSLYLFLLGLPNVVELFGIGDRLERAVITCDELVESHLR